MLLVRGQQSVGLPPRDGRIAHAPVGQQRRAETVVMVSPLEPTYALAVERLSSKGQTNTFR
jgi:hypothetical protein